jgi:hypothetical protein
LPSAQSVEGLVPGYWEIVGLWLAGLHGKKLGHWDLHSWMGNKYMVFFSQLNTSTWWACYHILKSSTTFWLGLKPSILWPKIKITLLWVDCYFFTVLKSWLVHVEVVSERRTSPSMVGHKQLRFGACQERCTPSLGHYRKDAPLVVDTHGVSLLGYAFKPFVYVICHLPVSSSHGKQVLHTRNSPWAVFFTMGKNLTSPVHCLAPIDPRGCNDLVYQFVRTPSNN